MATIPLEVKVTAAGDRGSGAPDLASALQSLLGRFDVSARLDANDDKSFHVLMDSRAVAFIREATGAIAPKKGKPSPENMDVPGYEHLARILKLAYAQSAHGKGKERHANSLPFHEQPIMQISRMVGLAGLSYQICKKVQEATTMVARDRQPAAVQEFLGAIVYAAAAILLTEELDRKRIETQEEDEF